MGHIFSRSKSFFPSFPVAPPLVIPGPFLLPSLCLLGALWQHQHLTSLFFRNSWSAGRLLLSAGPAFFWRQRCDIEFALRPAPLSTSLHFSPLSCVLLSSAGGGQTSLFKGRLRLRHRVLPERLFLKKRELPEREEKGNAGRAFILQLSSSPPPFLQCSKAAKRREKKGASSSLNCGSVAHTSRD